MHVSALRSRRSLRSLARCARLVMLNVLNNLERILRRKPFWNIEKLRTCTALSWSHVQQFCTVSKRLKTILNYFGVALAPSCSSWRLLRPSWRHFGTFWCLLGPSCRLLGESWRHLAPSWRHLGAYLPRLGAILERLRANLTPTCLPKTSQHRSNIAPRRLPRRPPT